MGRLEQGRPLTRPIDDVVSALHADFVVRVERVLAGRFTTAKELLTPRPGTAAELTLETVRSLCGEPERGFAAAGAIHAAFVAIALVDGLLDDDPLGDLSAGRTANVASVAHALTFALLADAEPSGHRAIANRIARMLVDTAWGQERDVTEACGGDTWSVAAAKSAPLFEAALYCGAIAGGASHELANDLERLGSYVGRIVQIQDDVTDVLEPGNDADWRRPSSNVALRYTLQVQHHDRARVEVLLQDAATEGDARDEIRRILGTCGAIEYGLSSVLFYADEARRYLERQPVDTHYLSAFIDRLTGPTGELMAGLGVDTGALAGELVSAFGSAM